MQYSIMFVIYEYHVGLHFVLAYNVVNVYVGRV